MQADEWEREKTNLFKLNQLFSANIDKAEMKHCQLMQSLVAFSIQAINGFTFVIPTPTTYALPGPEATAESHLALCKLLRSSFLIGAAIVVV